MGGGKKLLNDLGPIIGAHLSVRSFSAWHGRTTQALPKHHTQNHASSDRACEKRSCLATASAPPLCDPASDRLRDLSLHKLTSTSCAVGEGGDVKRISDWKELTPEEQALARERIRKRNEVRPPAELP